MTGPLPWDDPDRDVGADLVNALASRVYSQLSAEAAAAAAAAWLNSGMFRISMSSVAEAVRQMHTAAAAAHRDVAAAFAPAHVHIHIPVRRFTEPGPGRPAWKRGDRRTWHGGPVTHLDLDVDLDLVAEQTRRALDEQRMRAGLDYLGQMARGVVRVQTGRDVRAFNELDYYAERWSWPKGSGKRTAARRQLDAWIAEFERATGDKPTVFEWRGHQRDQIILDETRYYLGYDQLAAELEREERDHEAGRYFLNQYRAEQPEPHRPNRWYHSQVTSRTGPGNGEGPGWQSGPFVRPPDACP